MSKEDKKFRIKKLTIALMAILLCGFLYLLLNAITGIGIPCPFRMLTGLKCPGCGITTMFIELFHLNFIAAFWANPLTFCLLPFLVVLIIYLCWIYIKKGSLQTPKWLTFALIATIIIYIIFGIIRNLFLF